MLLKTLVDHLSSVMPNLYSTLKLADLTRFATLSAEVFAHTNGAWHLTEDSKEVEPFLRTALNLSISAEHCQHLWHTLFPTLVKMRVQPAVLIRQQGYRSNLQIKIPEVFLTPPVKKCLICPTSNTLHHRSQIDGCLYDVDGVHTTRIFTMKCPNCATHYRPSYYSSKGIRTYYSSIQGRNQHCYQVSCHFFMTHHLAELFQNGQMLAHISHFNLANLFNETFVEDFPIPRLIGAPLVQPFMSESTLGDGVDIHSLLHRADSLKKNMRVDPSLPSDQRYHESMQDVLEWIALEGTKHRDHVCSSCVRVITETSEDGENTYWRYIRAVVTDGVTIGHF